MVTNKPSTNKVESITVRVHPRVKYGLELLARKQLRTISAVVEWALNKALMDEDEGLGTEVFDDLWDPFEADRFVQLAFRKPDLLTYEEEVLWKLIRENGFLWKGHFYNKTWTWPVTSSSLIRERLRDQWEIFKAVSLGQETPDQLPSWEKEGIDKDGLLTEDDIPF